jgi:ribosome-associated protein
MARYHSSAMQEPFASKTKRKADMHALQGLGAALVGLTPAQLDAMPLPEPLADAVREARRISSHEGRRRQLQYIGKLMRGIDPEPIRAALATVEGNSAAARARHRRLELWRERLLADDAALTVFAREHEGADLQALRALIRNARKEIAETRPPRAQRELYRYLREIEAL